MGKLYKACAAQRIALLLFLFLAFLLFSSSVGFSKSPSKEAVKTNQVTIDGKTSYGISAGKLRVWVTEATTIVDAGGTRIALRDLSIPCGAKITYRQRADGYPAALRIEVR
jgi:hypothetical protein